MWHPFPAWLWRVPNHLDPPAELLLNPTLTTPRVALVYPQMFDAREVIGSSFQQQGHSSAILNVRRMHFRPQHEALAVDQDVAFAAVDAFGAVVAADAANTRRSDRLAVDDAGARLRVTPNTCSELLAQNVVEIRPGTVQTPQSKVVVAGLPGRELVREQPPRAATPNDVEDGVQDFAWRMKPWSADPGGWRQQRLQVRELSVGQISQVRPPQGDIPTILPAKPADYPVFRQFLVGHAAYGRTWSGDRILYEERKTACPLNRRSRCEPSPWPSRPHLQRIVNSSSERVDQVRRATAVLAVAEGIPFIHAAQQAGLRSGTTVVW
jgi:hypothetical protein